MSPIYSTFNFGLLEKCFSSKGCNGISSSTRNHLSHFCKVESFLNPSIKNFLPNPNTLLDMEKSSLRTLKAISNKEKIGVFGDYDVDGATSTALLGRYFDELKLNYEIYIPDRKTEGSF